ncbi:peptidoglycan-binding protein [Lyngbya aestuarii]|uniref:peptidoglycan-binding protein n=1 Tax=Lyngbya aestuarii TaxID=118322 RepID=UPI00403D9B52
MSDPSTLLLLTCATCLDGTSGLPEKNNQVCNQTQGQSQDNQSVTQSSPCISPPETLAMSPESRSSGLKSLKAKLLTTFKFAPRPAPPELFASVSAAAVSAQASPPSTTASFFYLGSQGEAVTKLQTRLKQLGYYSGVINGVYDQPTLAAVSKFQQAQGLKIDGITGPLTWAKLETLSTKSLPTAKETKESQEKTDSLTPAGKSPQARPGVGDYTEQFSVKFHPEYLWLLGWAVCCASGYVVIFKPSGYNLTGFKGINSYFNSKNGAFASTDQADREYLDLDEPVAIPAQGEDFDQAAKENQVVTSTKQREIETLPLASGPYCLLQGNSEDKNYLLWRNLYSGSAKIFEVGTDSNHQTATLNNTPKFGYFLPADSIIETYPETQDILAFFNNNTLKDICDLANYQNSKTKSGDRTHPMLSNSCLFNSGVNLWQDIFEEGAVPAISLEFPDRFLVPLAATGDSVESEPLLSRSSELTKYTQSEYQESNAMINQNGNGKKPDVAPNSKFIDQDDPGETVVGTLPTTNNKTGETYVYSLIDDAGGRFILKGNQLLIANQSLVNAQSTTSYSFTVRRTDNHGSSVDKSFKVDLVASSN